MALSINYFQISNYYRYLARRPFNLRTFSLKMSTVKRTIINTDKAPAAIGPYNQAVLADKTLYISGSLGLIPGKAELVEGGVKSEARQSLRNIGEILKAAGATYDNVVKTTIFLADINDFPIVNEVYKEYFTRNFPARATYQVAALPKAARVEIEAVAVLGEIKDN